MSLAISKRQKFMLGVLSAGGAGATFTPVQVQKLFFLIDREAASLSGGPYFTFAPYDYGPFDRAVYDELDFLAGIGLVLITAGRYRDYALSREGLLIGQQEALRFPPTLQTYCKACADWVLSLKFDQLVAAIYNKYPDMKANSIFKR